MILVTGAAGFLGSNLCRFYLEKGEKVIGIDNLITGRLENLNNCFSCNDFEFFKHDICDEITIDYKIDFIFHLASPASPKDYYKFPIETLYTGSIGTINVLKFAIKNKSRVLLASSSEIYGEPLVHPQVESYFGNVNPIGPRSVYDESKRFLESCGVAFQKKYGLDVKIARLFNTYGPKMKKDDGRVIPNFLTQLIENKNFTVYGDGSQTRSFCYVDDTIKCLDQLIKSDLNKPTNIGNPNEISINELLKIINEIKPNNLKVIFKDLPKDDPTKRKPDISKATRYLKWSPKVDLIEGLKKTLTYFEKSNEKI